MSHLEKHIRTHTEDRRHVCDLCGAAFILPHHLVRHNLIHSGVRPYQCNICNKQFTRKAGLTQHQFVHTGVRPYACDFPTCDKQFTDRTTLRRHLLTHSSEKPFICKECDKTFRTKSACRKHYLRHFKGEASFKCGVCEEMFKNEEQFKAHSATHEEKQRTGAYRCGFCLRVFKSQDDLDTHVPIHETGLVHACDQCAVKFYTADDLVNHINKHAEEGHCQESIHKHFVGNTAQHLVETGNQEGQVSKVLVVLQLPSTFRNLKNDQGALQVTNIQQLLGTAQIDKLVVTTDPISNSSSAVALELSHDQQQGIQQILQTTNVPQSAEDSMNAYQQQTVATATNTLETDLHAAETFDDSSNHATLVSSTELTAQSPFVLTAISQQSQITENEDSSKYLIVPPTGTTFTPVVEKSSLVYSNDETNSLHKNKMSKNRAFESESVFKSNSVSQTTRLVPSIDLFVQNDDNCGQLGNSSGENSMAVVTNTVSDGTQFSHTTLAAITLHQDQHAATKSFFQHTSDYHNTLEEHDLLAHAQDFEIHSN